MIKAGRLNPEAYYRQSLGTRSHGFPLPVPLGSRSGLIETRGLRNHPVLCFSVGLHVTDQDTRSHRINVVHLLGASIFF